MALAPGTRLGPYEILSPIGAGGMGEVYRGRDTRLDRTIAVKILPERFAENAELRQRFEREARAVSSLNHPHICALYDVGRHDGVDFLVMEYLEGETLSSRLRFTAVDNQLMAVDVQGRDDEFTIGATRGLFIADLPPTGTPYDVSSDGKKFIVYAGEVATSTPLTMVLHWDAALNR